MKTHKMFRLGLNVLCLSLLGVLNLTCESGNPTSKFKFINPNYSLHTICASTDTIHFPLGLNGANNIQTYNYFTDQGNEYFSVYEKNTQSISIYDFNSSKLLKRIDLKECLQNKRLKKVSVYAKSLDSIYIIQFLSMFLIDRNCKISDSISLKDESFPIFSSFRNMSPPIFKNSIIYTVAEPYLNSDKLQTMNKRTVIYKLDMTSHTAKTYYKYPDVYLNNLFGSYYLEPSYCYNNSNKFVFSFSADTNIYETDLEDYHVSYFARSKFQTEDIRPVDQTTLATGEANTMAFLLNYSYGPIVYDPYRKRYLRVAKQRLNEDDFKNRNWLKEQSIMIFDKDFRIIGESKVDRKLLLNSIFLTKNGNIYVRTKFEDADTLHYIRLNYDESNSRTNLSKLHKH